ncbi:MAG: hypothetical protein FWG94_10905, partial [Oscillospiraceae bacterium]|nr:hypothetical protein [Oscillospiraceae bacterium]
MTKRENLISLYKRKGYKKAPVEFVLCPELHEKYKKEVCADREYADYYGFSVAQIGDLCPKETDLKQYEKYHKNLKPGSKIDIYGVAREPGSEAARHMTHMRNPLEGCDSLNEMIEFPLPDFAGADDSHQKAQVEIAHKKGLAAMGNMQMTIWERAWYIRGMENLMVDMMMDDPMAEYILNKTTEMSTIQAKAYANAGCDLLFLGDDVGTQKSLMMSEELYTTWLKPRLKGLISEVKKINPEIIIVYHSCGYIEPLIPHLIDAGIDVLNPVQPECMDFKEIYRLYGDKLSFNGTIGTQTTMPFGTPQ